MQPKAPTEPAVSAEVMVREVRTQKCMAVTVSLDTQVAEVVRCVSARMHLPERIAGGPGGSGRKLQAWAGGKQLDAQARIGDIEFEGDRLVIELKKAP
jgi:hypothetical protein